MFGTRKVKPYATRADFCRIFETDMNGLYLLSFVLTGDRDMAENCFVGGLRTSQQENAVFKEWAQSWARRTIILNAIRMIRPRLTNATSPASDRGAAGLALTERAEIAAIVELPPFERFVFVMSVLELYSDHECALLLGCTQRDVIEARSRALQQTGSAAALRQKVVSIAEDRKALQEDLGSAIRQDLFPGLATSA